MKKISFVPFEDTMNHVMAKSDMHVIACVARSVNVKVFINISGHLEDSLLNNLDIPVFYEMIYSDIIIFHFLKKLLFQKKT